MRARDEMAIQALRQAAIDLAGSNAPDTKVVDRAQTYLAFLLNGRAAKPVQKRK